MDTLTNRLKLLNAILKVQKGCPAIPRTKEANVYSKTTKKSYTYKYASYDKIMEIVQPLLTENLLGVFHENITNEKGKVIVKTTLFHESGEFIETVCDDSIVENLGRMSRIQTIGNLKTFIKRYNVGDLLNLSVADDTDGIGLGDPENKKQKKDANKNIGPKAQIVTYEAKVTPASQQEEKPNPNYIYDGNNLKRYNVVSHKLNDVYQEKNGLVLSAEWLGIEKLIKKLEITPNQFSLWLEFLYGKDRKFFDIKKEELKGILDVLNNDSGQVLDIPKSDNK